jgi:hypothetical protein
MGDEHLEGGDAEEYRHDAKRVRLAENDTPRKKLQRDGARFITSRIPQRRAIHVSGSS